MATYKVTPKNYKEMAEKIFAYVKNINDNVIEVEVPSMYFDGEKFTLEDETQHELSVVFPDGRIGDLLLNVVDQEDLNEYLSDDDDLEVVFGTDTFSLCTDREFTKSNLTIEESDDDPW